MRLRHLALLLAASLGPSAAADAATSGGWQSRTMKLSGGGLVAIRESFAAGGAGFEAMHAQRALVYTVVDSAGRVSGGSVAGSEGALAREVAIAQNPVTGDVLMAFARPGDGGHDIYATIWLGQTWSEPQPLAATDADDRAPLLAFRATGDALLAWTSGRAAQTSVLLRHFEPTTGPEARTYSFSDLGAIAGLAGEAAALRSDTPVPVALVGGVDALAAYLLVGASDGSPLSVVRVGLDAIVDTGGFGAAPVPVSFIRSATQSAGGGSSLTTRAGTASEGEILAPWRLVLGNAQAWYWISDDVADLVVLPEGEAPRLRSFAAPSTEALLHVEAFRITRLELAVAARRPMTGDGSAVVRRGR